MESYEESLFATKVQFTHAALLNVFTTYSFYNSSVSKPVVLIKVNEEK